MNLGVQYYRPPFPVRKHWADDFKRIRDSGLNVVLSTIAELQPHWIHEAAAGSEMIDHRGHRVVSSLREESNFGLPPGGMHRAVIFAPSILFPSSFLP